MTPPTQDDLAAGRELDARVARDVMGLTGTKRVLLVESPEFSTDIAAAWQIVEHLTAQASTFHLWRSPLTKEWRVDVDAADGTDRVVGVWAPTVPLAICRAALKAVSA